MRTLTCLLFALPLMSTPVFGWGCDGHQMVALIARAHLTPAASAAVDRILREGPVDPALTRNCRNQEDAMADVSTWADDIRNRSKTGTWHYMDIPVQVESGNAMTWCEPVGPSVDGKDRPGCVITAVEYNGAILRDPAQSPAARADALRYVIHFVGDLHQPLHSTANNDQGGNCTAVRFFYEGSESNLHSIWDSKLIQRQLTKTKLTRQQYAATLDERFNTRSKEWGAWSPGAVESWIWESHKWAQKVVYGDLSPAIPVEVPDPKAACNLEREKVSALGIAVGQRYFEQSVPAVDEQLAKAGFRLAGLLNETLK